MGKKEGKKASREATKSSKSNCGDFREMRLRLKKMNVQNTPAIWKPLVKSTALLFSELLKLMASKCSVTKDS